MGLCRSGWKKCVPFPHVNEIPEHFFRVQIDRHKALPCCWCGALPRLWLAEVITGVQNMLFHDQPLRAWSQPCCLWNVWYGDSVAVGLEGTEHIRTQFLNSRYHLSVCLHLPLSRVSLEIRSCCEPHLSSWCSQLLFFHSMCNQDTLCTLMSSNSGTQEYNLWTSITSSTLC